MGKVDADARIGFRRVAAARAAVSSTRTLDEGRLMVVALFLLLLIAILFGVGVAAVKALIWIGVVLFVLWLVGWMVGAGAAAGAGRRRWYYW